jgi:hypothetical protein
MRSIQKQLGTWEPSQHLFEDRGIPRRLLSRWSVTGPSRCIQIIISTYINQKSKLCLHNSKGYGEHCNRVTGLALLVDESQDRIWQQGRLPTPIPATWFQYLSGEKRTSCKVTTNGLRKVRAGYTQHTTCPAALLGMRWFPRDLIPSQREGQAGGVIKAKNTGPRIDTLIPPWSLIWERQRGMMVELKQNSFVGEWTWRWDERSEKNK